MSSVLEKLKVFDQLPLPEQADFVRTHFSRWETFKVMTRNMGESVHTSFYQACLAEKERSDSDLKFN
ncbi:hypothetical protein A3D88_04175 [Candidatus Peribacteria bacterium RIFCSPHIGHO2_02_FULL_52_16]|nr:MAG: hypothetical protein A2706_00920 [Candidatus Peribacteria bacterium RIFCSPHIGHO2_01_FULL_51_35]OGJ60812.1 MAG: hypothetical protein A3D88_04175 [Candidatus Peribacteria bacterium RIFCSPHIGHO2_02_FULL_52_16]